MLLYVFLISWRGHDVERDTQERPERQTSPLAMGK